MDSKKLKQLRRINELDIDDELYDDLMKTYRAGVQEVNEQIATIENQMYQNDLSIENAQGENLSNEVYKRIIDEMLNHIDNMPDSDKKLMMNLLIEKVEIYKEKQKDGRWVKSVQFKDPLNVGGKLVDTMLFDDDEDTEKSPFNEKHVEMAVPFEWSNGHLYVYHRFIKIFNLIKQYSYWYGVNTHFKALLV